MFIVSLRFYRKQVLWIGHGTFVLSTIDIWVKWQLCQWNKIYIRYI